jgi:multidrug efflux pump subunit AcrA (membrane-fusion protein)
LERLKRIRHGLDEDIRIAESEAKDLIDESTAELEANIAQIDEINAKVRANLDRAKAVEDASAYTKQYNDLTGQIDEVRGKKRALLDGAELPLPGLGVENGALVYNGQAWDCMSSSEQLKVATAIVRKLNPDCGFVLVDKLEQMDAQTMREFGAWLEGEGLQVIATRVTSAGEDCTILIEDGTVVESKETEPLRPSGTSPFRGGKGEPSMTFTEGVF